MGGQVTFDPQVQSQALWFLRASSDGWWSYCCKTVTITDRFRADVQTHLSLLVVRRDEMTSDWFSSLWQTNSWGLSVFRLCHVTPVCLGLPVVFSFPVVVKASITDTLKRYPLTSVPSALVHSPFPLCGSHTSLLCAVFVFIDFLIDFHLLLCLSGRYLQVCADEVNPVTWQQRSKLNEEGFCWLNTIRHVIHQITQYSSNILLWG